MIFRYVGIHVMMCILWQCLKSRLKVTETLQYVATYLVHINVTSQTIIYPNPNPNPNPQNNP